ncbi:uncharacterized protein LOC143846895 isoform X2 [Tasmannia lanceolata]|uniref:uncharacterized protein LOC143846895 isoform X2 n=1 Tax=Tasmannia lanceolata TaxID=3420 RepID=UPI004063CC14
MSSEPPLPFYTALLLLCLSTTLNALTLPSDIFALKSFKSQIKPSSIPPWSCLSSWNFTFDPCSSPRTTHFICGLTCTSDSTRVISLVLDPVGYIGTLSPFLSNLTQLTHLDLSDNSFYSQIPSSLSSLSNLQTLTLKSNSFSSNLPPSLFPTLKNLQTLDISHNTLIGTLPQTLKFLSSLKTLDLSFNSLVGPLPNLPPNLSQLALKANSLSGSLLQSSFQGLTQLKVVELSSNTLTGTLNNWFFLLPSLQQIDLANNSLTRVEILDPTARSSEIVAVDLGFNKIEGQLPINFVNFPLLSALSLRYNRFRGPIPGEYGKESLRRLFLDGNFLEGRVPAGFFRRNSVSGSLGDNCLESCPTSLPLCFPSQKPVSVCKEAYRRSPRGFFHYS